MAVLRRYLWISALAFGLIFLALGAFVVVKGLAAKAEIRDRLAEEQVYTSKDAVSFGVDEGVLVQDAKTAQAQADTIRLHTLERYGPYAKMAKDDPNRATFVNGVALRGALGLAVVGFGLADMAIFTGILNILMGVATLAIAVPALYWAGEAERQVVREVGRQVAPRPSYTPGGGQ
ncbi:MAG TPA: hypothetical protein VJ256_05530 [Dehalococcoidia bacterium]|nr:hypothetical protein [Dehalococcoidia bacterium]